MDIHPFLGRYIMIDLWSIAPEVRLLTDVHYCYQSKVFICMTSRSIPSLLSLPAVCSDFIFVHVNFSLDSTLHARDCGDSDLAQESPQRVG